MRPIPAPNPERVSGGRERHALDEQDRAVTASRRSVCSAVAARQKLSIALNLPQGPRFHLAPTSHRRTRRRRISCGHGAHGTARWSRLSKTISSDGRSNHTSVHCRDVHTLHGTDIRCGRPFRPLL